MSRRALKAINWAALAERIPESEKNVLAAFKTKSDLYLRKVQENPETAPKIDWTHYKKVISVPGMVDSFQKQYESLQIPYPADNYTATVEAQEKEAVVDIEKFIQESNKEIERAKGEITRIQGLLPISEMTMEDFKDSYPEYALDPLNNPTIYPHDPDRQPGSEKEEEKSSH
ncbi:ATP synthase subunit d, mitochondrial-like [Belonocnema kinseyi]|uniref:ATP synthase subunit d, mitochondrial-like n=1 Tax=Belonocnema kinseyi TaxID=2817044 RepID=UPI00143DB2C5|nr:ATP synthase subunit d, mitochondrial-like [Belonocnema kinseyi]